MNECILIQLYYMCLTSSYTHLGEVNAGKMHWGLKQVSGLGIRLKYFSFMNVILHL